MQCCICESVLPVSRRQTCIPCEHETRALLRQVMDCYALLPSLLGSITMRAADKVSGSRDTSLPGGDALVILGPGSDRSSDSTVERASDPQSLDMFLIRWADYWADEMRAIRSPWGWGNAFNERVRTTFNYLSAYNYWAAENHSAYADYYAELSVMLSTMERLLHMHAAVERLPAPCPVCKGKLRRTNGPPVVIRCGQCQGTYDEDDYRRIVFLALVDADGQAGHESDGKHP